MTFDPAVVKRTDNFVKTIRDTGGFPPLTERLLRPLGAGWQAVYDILKRTATTWWARRDFDAIAHCCLNDVIADPLVPVGCCGSFSFS